MVSVYRKRKGTEMLKCQNGASPLVVWPSTSLSIRKILLEALAEFANVVPTARPSSQFSGTKLRGETGCKFTDGCKMIDETVCFTFFVGRMGDKGHSLDLMPVDQPC